MVFGDLSFNQLASWLATPTFARPLGSRGIEFRWGVRTHKLTKKILEQTKGQINRQKEVFEHTKRQTNRQKDGQTEFPNFYIGRLYFSSSTVWQLTLKLFKFRADFGSWKIHL